MGLERRSWLSARLEGCFDQRHRRPGVLNRRDQMSVLAGAKALQVRHPADESIGKPRASKRNLGPFRLALRPNPQFVRFAARIVKEEPELGVRRALSPIETELGCLMFATEGGVVIDRHRRADLVS